MDELVVPALSHRDNAGLRNTLSALVGGARSALGYDLVGAYLVGSLALGAGDRHSDVDFVVITRDPVSAVRLGLLEELHDALPALSSFGADHLEGSYIATSELGSQSQWLYIDNGSRIVGRSDHDNTQAFRWVLRKRGLTLFGPSPVNLLPAVDQTELTLEARERARSWVELLRSDPAVVDDAWAQTHFVTGLCRLLFTFKEGSIVSKEEATSWSAAYLGPRWNRLLDQALIDRQTTWDRVGGTSDPVLAAETVQLSIEVVRQMAG